ncbi:MAG: DEAD/DEAH box helicase [Candidatus Heimdallarchaeaceae archaeon]
MTTMDCPDCKRQLSVTSEKSIYTFQCTFCGFHQKIIAQNLSQAYEKLIIKEKEIRFLNSQLTRKKREGKLLKTPKKSPKEKEKVVECGGFDPNKLPPVAKKVLTNPDAELIYYKYLQQESPKIAKVMTDLPEKLKRFLEKKNLTQLYQFQLESFQAIKEGRDVVIVAPTGTGKTEAFLLPLLSKIWNKGNHPLLRRGIFAIIIYPTKALARDQAKKIKNYGQSIDVSCEIFDGDTPKTKREQIFESPPDILITNPDMLHYHLRTPRFREIIRKIEMVIVDEIHVAVGAYGSNLHFILKRLERLTNKKLQFVGSSATIGNAKEFSSKLFSRDVFEIKVEKARKAPTHLFLIYPWGVSQYTVTSEIVRELVRFNHKTLCFQNSHKNAEIINLLLKQQRIKSSIHRAGLPKEYRYRVETMFREGVLEALVSTPTLELGIDIGDVDGVVSSIVDITSFTQRLGRAGRKGQESLGVLVLRNDDPISSFYSLYPESYFEDIRKGYIEPKNEIVSYFQILSSILEKPADEREFEEYKKILDQLVIDDLIKKTQKGTYRVKNRAKALQILYDYSIRGIGDNIIIKKENGEKIGDRSMPMAARELHPGAIYLHGGKYYQSQSFKYDSRFSKGEVVVEEIKPSMLKSTAMRYAIPNISSVVERKKIYGVEVIYCNLTITENVVGYKLSDIYKNEVKEIRQLDEPIVYTFPTKGFVFSMPKPQKLHSKTLELSDKVFFSGTFHALEHVIIESSSMITGGGSSEIGGIAMGESGTIFVYDGAKGGSGLSKLLFDKLEEAFNRSLKILENCSCTNLDGCPRCTYSYQCGNNNQPLNKIGAIESLKLLGSMELEIVDDFANYESYV